MPLHDWLLAACACIPWCRQNIPEMACWQPSCIPWHRLEIHSLISTNSQLFVYPPTELAPQQQLCGISDAKHPFGNILKTSSNVPFNVQASFTLQPTHHTTSRPYKCTNCKPQLAAERLYKWTTVILNLQRIDSLPLHTQQAVALHDASIPNERTCMLCVTAATSSDYSLLPAVARDSQKLTGSSTHAPVAAKCNSCDTHQPSLLLYQLCKHN
jgi:hypothetical protein